MSKKLANEKEIEKARLERKWKKIITLVSSLNVKNAGGALSSGLKSFFNYSFFITYHLFSFAL